MTHDWSPLRRELAQWRAENRELPIWWRDDDAIDQTVALDRLTGLSCSVHLPVHLAVIPAHATVSLARFVAEQPHLIPVVHGWTHENNSPIGEKKAEFGHRRPNATDALGAALKRMRLLFGDALVPMFVPPWNRFAPHYTATLAMQGYGALSTYLPRSAEWPCPGLVQINTHLDPIAWRGTGGLVEADVLVGQLARLLQDRRHGRTDSTEPLGYLTHHLVHDAEIWAFSEAVLRELLEGGAVPADIGKIVKTQG